MTENEATEVVASATPLLRVVKGDPTAEELAALVAVVAARNAAAAATDSEQPKPRSEWGHPVRQHRGAHRVGRGQWRASAW